MIKYLLLGMLSTIFWSLTYFIPMYAVRVPAILIVLGGYAVYGIFSLISLGFQDKESRLIVFKYIKPAIYFAVIGNFGYSIGAVLAAKNAGTVMLTLIIGLSPIATLLYDRMVIDGKFTLRSVLKLLLPAVLIIFGLIVSEWTELYSFQAVGSRSNFIFGLAAGIVALLCWTIFTVQNARFLKKYPEISNAAWSTALGIGSLFASLLGFLLVPIFLKTAIFPSTSLTSSHALLQYLVHSSYIHQFLISILLFGIAALWVYVFIWNSVVRNLPIAWVNFMALFEASLNVMHDIVYMHDLPALSEVFGLAIVASGILLSIKYQNQYMAIILK